MFKNNKDKGSIHLHPGVFEFDFPFLIDPLLDTPMYYCHVKVHIGDDRDLQKGYLATVILSPKEEGNFINKIERVATNIKKTIIDELLRSVDNYEVIEDKIRWIDRQEYPVKYNHSLVKMTWDQQEGRYKDPHWVGIEKEDWAVMENN